MSNARIQFSLASEDVWNAYNPQLKEGEIVTVLKANKKVKLVQGKVGGSTYSESTVIWDQDTAETIMSRSEAAGSTATAQAAAAIGSASNAAASQSAAATSAANAKASENAAKTSETNAKSSEAAAKNSATSAASSASTASTQAGKAADSATTAAGSATQAGTFATTATNQATAAAKSESNAKAYMDTTKNLSENVNVFVPSVDADGTLTWTNKAGLANPATVNIKGAKGDKGEQGIQGATGPQGEKGSTGATGPRGLQGETGPQGERGPQGLQGPQGEKGDKGEKGDQGTGVTIKGKYDSLSALQAAHPKGNDGDAYMVGTSLYAWTGSAWVDCGNIQGPKGDRGDTGPQGATGPQGPKGDKGDGADITVDAELSNTSTNPIQNKVVKTAIDTVTASIPTKVSALENDAGYLTQHQSLAGYTKTSVVNTWTAQQNFYDLMLNREKYTTYVVNSTSDKPITSTMVYAVTGAFTLDLSTLAGALSASQSSVFTAYFAANADYSLTISNAGKLKYVGSASDVAITSTGLLLNVWMSKDGGGTLTSIVQASKLS